MSTPDSTSPFAPFRRRAFFWLWLGVVVASIGAWGQTVGAQWLFVNDPNAATIVPLVQTASTLPMMLLALPAGVIADAFDRRWIMVAIQIYSIAVACALATLTMLGLMPPGLLLAFTFAVGIALATLSPTWQATITELVPRSQFAAATRLDMVSVNVARAAGPALAGLVIANWGVAPVFWLNALAGLVLLLVLLAWRRPTVRAERRERFLPALRSGARYVRHEPAVVAILVRFGAFVFPAGAVWALLPLIASHQLGLDASGYGVLFSALGVGAVCGALGLGLVKRRLTSSTILTLAGLAFAAAFLALAFMDTLWKAVPLLVVCGLAWSASVATVVSELQLFVPGWVRARVIAIYLMVFLGIQAVAAPIWGLITSQFGLRTALILAGGIGFIAALACSRMPVPDGHSMQRTPVVFWDAPALQVEPASPSGPVLVVNRYRVDPQNHAGFVEAMGGLRGSRLRSGASKWSLYLVGEKSGWFVEQFLVSSWEEHERQHDGRLTVEDRDIEEKVLALTTERGSPEHLLPARRSAE